MTTELLDERAAAAVLRVQRGTLSAWRLRHQGPKYIRVGRSVRYHPDDLSAYISQRTVEPTTGTMRADSV